MTQKITFKDFLFVAPCIILVAFLCIYCDWEYDEAWTYNQVSRVSFLEIILYQKYNLANNHLLNSLYVKFIQIVGLKNLLFFRLISFAAFVTFCFTTIKILKTYYVKPFWCLPVILFTYLPYAHLARGYIVALALLSLSLLYLIKCITDQNPKSEVLFFIFGFLSSLGIVSFFYGFVALLTIFFLTKLANRTLNFKYIYLMFMLFFLGLSGYIYHVGKTIIKYDLSIAGGEGLLKNGCLSSIVGDISYQVYFRNFSFDYLIRLAVFFLIGITIVWYLMGYKRISIKTLSLDSITFVALILIVFFLFIANTFLGAKYPFSRATFHMQYLLILFLVAVIAKKPNKFYFLLFFITIIPSMIREYLLIQQLTKPSFAQISKLCNSSTLYIYGHNQSFQLANELYNPLPKTIIQSEDLGVLKSQINKSTEPITYLYSDKEGIIGLDLSYDLVSQGREGMSLYKIKKN